MSPWRRHPVPWFGAGAGLFIALTTTGCEQSAAPERALAGPSKANLRFVAVRPGQAQTVLRAPARLVATASSSAELTFLAAGVVRRISVRIGDLVRAGDPLLEIASPALAEAAGEWRSSVDALEFAEERLRRLEQLVEERIASEDELQARREDIAQLRGRQRQLRAMLRAHGVEPKRFDALLRNGGVELPSPVDGVVRHLHVRLGQAVGPDRGPLATVVGESRPRVEAMLQRRPSRGLDYAFVAADGTRHRVASPSVGSISDPRTGTWTSWFEVAGEVRIVGDRVGELLGMARGNDVFTVPVEALGRDEDGSFVARRQETGAPERVEVEVLDQDDDRAVVRAELSASDEVAVEPRARPSRHTD